MKYGDAVETIRPSMAMQRKLFESILLSTTGEPIKQFQEYFCHQAYEAWRYKVTQGDLDNVQFVGKICDELYRLHKEEFLELASAVLEEKSNVADILQQSERRYYEADDDDNDAKLTSALNHYKAFFESALRLWSSIPYFYAVRVLGVKSEAKDASDFLRVSSGEKYQCLKARIVYLLQQGKLSDLVNNFSNQLRNAGGGHDSYEFLDDGSVKLHISKPKSGKTKTMILTYSEIKEHIDGARKAIWILRNGLFTFLNKNPRALAEVSRKTPLKIREINVQLKSDARDRVFKLNSFDYDRKKKVATLNLEKRRQFGGRSSELLFGNGERYEIITVATEVKLEEQLFGMLQLTDYLMNDNYPLEQLAIVFTDEDGLISQATFAKEVVRNASKRDKVLPKPMEGVLPIGTYDLYSPISVPYGLGKAVEAQMRIEGYRIVS